jgi:hypothetical protein
MWSCYDTKVGLSYNSKGKSTFFEEAKFASLIQDSEMPLLRRICSYELGKPISKVLKVLLIASVSEFWFVELTSFNLWLSLQFCETIMVQIHAACKEKADFFPELTKIYLQTLLDYYLSNSRKSMERDLCQAHFELIKASFMRI